MHNLGALHARAINSNNIVLSEEDGLPRLVNLAWVQEHQCVEVHAARGGEQNDIDASVASMYIY